MGLAAGEWSLHQEVFHQICLRWGTPDVNLTAFRMNRKVPQFISRSRDPLAVGVDALAIPWSRFVLPYLFPPFPLLPKLLKKIKEEGVPIILIAPDCPGELGSDLPPEFSVAQFNGVAVETAVLRVSSLLDRVIHTMIQARKPSSSRIYYRTWKAYLRWCESNRVSAMSFSLPSILAFLQAGLDSGLALSSLKGQGDSPVSSIVAVAFLVAITSIRRVSELAALSCRPPFLVIHQDKVVLRLPPSFLPKVVSTFHLNEDIVLPSFCPAPTHPLERSLNKLDLIRAVRIYLDRMSAFRKTDSLFVIPDGARRGLPASKATIARWIRTAILEAYRVKNRVPPPGIKAHSTRAVGASWAVFSKAGEVKTCSISKKKNKQGTFLSMGYGFVEYRKPEHAQKALRQLQHCTVDDHQIEVKLSERAIRSVVPTDRKKQVNKKQKTSKILVRNVPFQATVKEVRELFSTFGELKTVRLPKKMAGTGAHRGFGFVDFVTKQDAKLVMPWQDIGRLSKMVAQWLAPGFGSWVHQGVSVVVLLGFPPRLDIEPQ
ncbi:unnamed protein product [Ranitomeya imitator]|uniref:RRM domain-containing protein n=1 Tax=Ranitomeya imitator TaxID=111125 RepID=A0ABN9L6U9_9NEOB|nr:unnamed protein product [Ranitomeya imitator]